MLNDWSGFLRRGMSRAAPIVAIVATAATAWAQGNTAGIRGAVTGPDGAAVAGAQVTLRHVPTGSEQVTLTNASGAYAFTGQRVGGPYTLAVFADGYLPQGVENIYLNVGKNLQVPVGLQLSTEVIEIEGRAPTPRNTSPVAVFDARDIDALPSVGRDPKDIVKLTPEAYLDDNNSQAMSIGGANNRFNSVTIDGIRQDDDFGLNANGYPTQRSPISMSAIEEIAVETSPFDVRYGRFLGGNVNIVTKSGTNELSGSVLGTFANNDFVGTRSGDDELIIDFREFRFGATLGGPIVRDKVHFFVGVEALDATIPTSVGPAGSGATNEVTAVSVADLEQVQQIARDVYGFDAGVPSQSLDELDLKIIGKVDWAITDDHRLSAKYQRTSGNVIRDSFVSDRLLPLTSNWFDLNETLNSFSVKLLSNWTPQLSTEAEISGKIVDNRQNPLAGSGFMQAEIGTADGGTIVIGPDVFRHANKLDNDNLHAKLEANYLLSSHLITGGLEYDRLSIFNLFVPSSNGDVTYASIDDFANMQPESIFYSNAVTNDPNDGAANWGYGVLALFLQDQFEVTPQLTIQGGVRAEVYQAETDIRRNDSFVARHGFDNTATINGRFIPMPRLGISYRPLPRLNLRTGAGLYSGGTPAVWISNNYTNDGVTIVSTFNNDLATLAGFDGRTIPQELQAALMEGDGSVDALDPDFDIPSTWKVAAGADYSFDLPGAAWRNFGVKVDYTFSKVRDGLLWQDLRRDLASIDNNTPVGTLPDGRPLYDNDNSDGAAFNQRRGFDMLLTNTDEGHGHTASVSLHKGFPFGLQLFGAYAFQRVFEVSPGTSSRSVSNYGLAAVGLDPNDPGAGISNYERAHRFIGAVRLSRPLVADLIGASNRGWHVQAEPPKLWRDTMTSIAVFLESRSGQPYSYTFGDSAGGNALAQLFGEEREFARRNRMLFYVPNGTGDDVILDGIDEAELNRFLEETGLDRYRGQIAPRNAFRSSWVNRVDVRLAQDIPNPIAGQRARLMVDFQNLGNMLNSEWGRVEQVGFPYVVPVVDVNVDPATGRYVYSNLRTQNPERVNVLASVWRVQVNLAYEF